MSSRFIEPANGHTIINASELTDAVCPLSRNEDEFVPVVLVAGHKPELLAIRRITFDGNRSQLTKDERLAEFERTLQKNSQSEVLRELARAAYERGYDEGFADGVAAEVKVNADNARAREE